MDEFIVKLQQFFDTEADPDLQNECEILACKYLINDNGSCNWSNIELLKSNGYKVYAGEKDSFGWLTGVIENGNGQRIVYG